MSASDKPSIYGLAWYWASGSEPLQTFTPRSFSSVEDDMYALGKAHMRSTPSLRRFPNVAFQTVPMFLVHSKAYFKLDRLRSFVRYTFPFFPLRRGGLGGD